MKKLPFASEKASREFMTALMLMVMKEFDRNREKHVSNENTHCYYHGRIWRFKQETGNGYIPQTGELSLQSTKCTVNIDRILENDLDLVPDFIRQTAEQFAAGLAQRLSAVAELAARESGHCATIPQDGPIDFVAMIRAMDLIVGPDGNISRPVLHGDSNFWERLCRDETLFTEEMKQRIDAAWKEKEEEARAREKERLSRFKLDP